MCTPKKLPPSNKWEANGGAFEPPSDDDGGYSEEERVLEELSMAIPPESGYGQMCGGLITYRLDTGYGSSE